MEDPELAPPELTEWKEEEDSQPPAPVATAVSPFFERQDKRDAKVCWGVMVVTGTLALKMLSGGGEALVLGNVFAVLSLAYALCGQFALRPDSRFYRVGTSWLLLEDVKLNVIRLTSVTCIVLAIWMAIGTMAYVVFSMRAQSYYTYSSWSEYENHARARGGCASYSTKNASSSFAALETTGAPIAIWKIPGKLGIGGEGTNSSFGCAFHMRRLRHPGCLCALATKNNVVHVLCDPEVASWEAPWSIYSHDWELAGCGPAYVPAVLRIYSKCGASPVELRGTDALLGVRVLQFLRVEPNSRAFFGAS